MPKIVYGLLLVALFHQLGPEAQAQSAAAADASVSGEVAAPADSTRVRTRSALFADELDRVHADMIAAQTPAR